jgi:hypothetical protein
VRAFSVAAAGQHFLNVPPSPGRPHRPAKQTKNQEKAATIDQLHRRGPDVKLNPFALGVP